MIDRAAHTATVAGRALDLSPLEFDLLAALAARPEQVLSHGQLLREVWGVYGDDAPGRVKYAVLRLRRKIAAATGGRTGISTVRGVAYRYRPVD
ncbi:winged helix-turn-helix domain-containing protein [Streptomyces sp. KLOTTS4A1]|uniref:winged helix-turn-helix domain-containing protein n=1 Tax=Streptomyces sp. KLOTTS4A1 TaxID=3390996 RepID=UPI0039F60818